MANVSGASLAPIYNRLNAAPSYHPLEADTFADWSLEAGDIVTVTRDGKSYESPVHSSTVTWKKGQQVKVSSGGNEERDSVSKMSQRKFNRGSSGLRATEERYRQIETSYNGMRSGLILASSSAALYVNNKYTQMQSGLFLTESSAHLYTNNRYTQMQSGLKLTESSAHLYTNNKYTQMQSGLKLTESSAHLYTNNKYTQMSSGLSLSSSSAALYVNNKYTQMQSGLQLSEKSARLYVESKTSRAEIIARINANGEGEALINADKVKLSGTTTINSVFTVIENAVGVSVPLITKNIDVGSNSTLNLYTATFQGSNPVTLTALVLANVIKSASVSGNTLTLTPFIGDAITFSKATSLSGTWSSGHLEVTASPQNSKYHQYIISGDAEDTSSDNNSWYVPILAKNDPNSQSSSRTGHRVYVNATARYNAGKTQGYKNAANDMSWPSQISGQNDKTEVDIGYPTTSGSSSTRTLKLTKDSAGAYLQLGRTLIMKISL